jgi:tetratricopeptide (TPR) repeat protein
MSLKITDKLFLIIDDFTAMSSSMTAMLESFGVARQNIYAVGNADAAFRLMELHFFDVILCDYNLGDGKKDGQQILEEARFKKTIKLSTLYIMVTAENSPDMVSAAVEHKPDYYLVKPVNKDMFGKRLIRMLKTRQEYASLHGLIEQEKYDEVIKICLKNIKGEYTKPMPYHKPLIDAFIRKGDNKSARTVLERVLAIRRLPWVLLELGVIEIQAGNPKQAEAYFEETLEIMPLFLEPHDHLAKINEQQGKGDLAQRHLEKATKIAPKVIARQKKLAQVALRNDNYEIAEKAFTATIRHGKNSIFKAVEEYTGLAKIHVKNHVSHKALTILDTGHNVFKGDRKSNLNLTCVDVLAHNELGNKSHATKLLHKIMPYMDQLKNSLSQSCQIDFAHACISTGETEKGVAQLLKMVRNEHENKLLILDITRTLKESGMSPAEAEKLVDNARGEIIKVNNQGVMLFKQGKFDESIQTLQNAADELPDNFVLNQNVANAMMVYIQRKGVTTERLSIMKKHLDRLDIKPSNQNEKLIILQNNFRKFSNSKEE